MKAKITLPITFIVEDITPEMTDGQIAERLRSQILEDGLEEYVNEDNIRIERDDFPRKVTFKCHSGNGLTSDAQQWLQRIRDEVKITLLDENVLQIDYPSDIIKQVRTVNVDDTIFRLDLVSDKNRYWACNSIFPDIPWKREFFNNRFSKGIREESKGHLVITYPKKGDKLS